MQAGETEELDIRHTKTDGNGNVSKLPTLASAFAEQEGWFIVSIPLPGPPLHALSHLQRLSANNVVKGTPFVVLTRRRMYENAWRTIEDDQMSVAYPEKTVWIHLRRDHRLQLYEHASVLALPLPTRLLSDLSLVPAEFLAATSHNCGESFASPLGLQSFSSGSSCSRTVIGI